MSFVSFQSTSPPVDELRQLPVDELRQLPVDEGARLDSLLLTWLLPAMLPPPCWCGIRLLASAAATFAAKPGFMAVVMS